MRDVIRQYIKPVAAVASAYVIGFMTSELRHGEEPVPQENQVVRVQYELVLPEGTEVPDGGADVQDDLRSIILESQTCFAGAVESALQRQITSCAERAEAYEQSGDMGAAMEHYSACGFIANSVTRMNQGLPSVAVHCTETVLGNVNPGNLNDLHEEEAPVEPGYAAPGGMHSI
ncbi:hypothetical protein KY362_05680 [Candidatus Woesearchaeota archaeon]|nr:hypothetical protein [Candidatus Woesearchaeota archaeon]